MADNNLIGNNNSVYVSYSTQKPAIPSVVRLLIRFVGVRVREGWQLCFDDGICEKVLPLFVSVVLLVASVCDLVFRIVYPSYATLFQLSATIEWVIKALWTVIIVFKIGPALKEICMFYNRQIMEQGTPPRRYRGARMMGLVFCLKACVDMGLMAFYLHSLEFPKKGTEDHERLTLDAVDVILNECPEVFNLAVFLIHFSICLLFHLVVNNLRAGFEDLSVAAKEGRISVKASCQEHEDKCKLSNEILDKFSPCLMWMFCSELAESCLYIKDLVGKSQYGVYSIPQVTFSVFTLVWLAFKGQQLETEGRQFASDILENMRRDNVGTDPEALHYISTYHSHLLANSPAVTVYGLFNVNMQLLLTICEIVVSYTIVLMEIDDKLDEQDCHCHFNVTNTTS